MMVANQVIALIPSIPFPYVLTVFITSLSAIIYIRFTKKESLNTTTKSMNKQSINDPKKHFRSDPTQKPKQINLTPAELLTFSNENPELPVYVAIKGTIFDVSSNREAYPFGKGYGIFAGIDASRALAKSSLNKSDCVPEWQDLTNDQIKVLDDWVKFYEKKYPKVGIVVSNK